MATSKKTDVHEKDEATVDAKAGGAAAGGATGALIGAAVGGPVGAGVGAVVGAAAGGLTGAALDYNEVEPEFRKHYESGPFKAISKWEEVEPAYRHGYDYAGREEYRGKAFDQVRGDLKKSWKSKSQFEDMEPLVRTAYERRVGTAGLAAGTAKATTARAAVAGETTIPVVEEEVQVGKRKVEKGGVRVETSVVETPVEETVRLHEEHVHVERRPANRAATAADTTAAMKEGTLELRETAEEAVVSKRARVIEEVVISKSGRDRTETVRETARRTDVNVSKTDTPARVVETEWKTLDTDFRGHAKKLGHTYDEITPAYRFGYDLAGDDRYRGDWTTVEPEARKLWEARNKGTWDQFKDSVRYAWDKATGQR